MEIIYKPFNELTLEELYEILKLRVNIFVVEQQCPYPELDDNDQDSIHVFIRDGEIQAYLRIIRIDEKIIKLGRVLAVKRRKGFATRLLKDVTAYARKQKIESILVDAQTYAVPFYENSGFIVISPEFMEDDIPHVKMQLKL